MIHMEVNCNWCKLFQDASSYVTLFIQTGLYDSINIYTYL